MKRTLEPRMLRPPLQLLKPLSVGSGQGMLGAQASPRSTEPEPPREPVLSRFLPPMTTWVPPRLEPHMPPEEMLPLEKVTPLQEGVELVARSSGPHTTPPRELLTAAGGRNIAGAVKSFRIPSVGWGPGLVASGKWRGWKWSLLSTQLIPTFPFSCLGDSEAVALLESNIQSKVEGFSQFSRCVHVATG